jgi:glycosyltransferase involved in cell wall biosynthesis
MATIALDVRMSTPGGGKTYVESLVPELARASDHRFVLVRVKDDGLDLPDLPTVWALGAGPAAQTAWSQGALPQVLRALRADLYHSLKHPGPVLGGVRSVFTLRAAGPFDGVYPMRLPELLYWNLLGRLFLSRVDHVIAVSRFVARSLPPDLAPAPDRLDVIAHGLPEAYRVAAGPRGPGPGPVLAVGNVVQVKNFPLLVRAYSTLPSSLRRRHPLVIAGEAAGREAARVRAAAAKSGVADQVRLAGYLGRDALRRAYLAADLFVVSSLQESFSFALLEAMACALPCVVTDCGGPPEVGGNAVRVVADPRDARALALAIEEVLSDPEAARRLGERARERALGFSWAETARRTLDVYARVLSRPPRADR